MLTTKAKILAACGLGVGVLVLSIPGYFLLQWYQDRDVRRAAMLREQLLQGDELPRTERNALKLQLIRTMDEMDREKRRALEREYMHEQREHMRQAAEEYQSALSQTERNAILDRELALIAKMQDLGLTDFAAGMRRGGRGNRGNVEDRDRGRAQRDRRGEGRQENSNRRQAQTEQAQADRAQAEQMGQYLQALRERAEKQGVALGRRPWPPRR